MVESDHLAKSRARLRSLIKEMPFMIYVFLVLKQMLTYLTRKIQKVNVTKLSGAVECCFCLV